MLISEEKAMLKRIEELMLKAESDFKAGLITEEKFNEINKLFDDAEAEIFAFSQRAEERK